jgi:metal transporter CNNM
MITIIWIGILICLAQSAMFSGLNLAVFALSKLELEIEARKRNPRAVRILQLRENTNLTLVTILWGNVSVNVLLALLSGSILTGAIAFLFSTVIITVFAEIIPQAYFSRHALRVTAYLTPIFRFYQIALYPIARPTAWMLDKWLGGEEIRLFREHDLRHVIRLHMESAESEIARMEGQGALNFLNIDDVLLNDEGEPLDPESIIQLDFDDGNPVFPLIIPDRNDAFLKRVAAPGKSWIIITDGQGDPRLALSADDFIRDALFNPAQFKPLKYCHRPIVVRDPNQKLGNLIPRFRLQPKEKSKDIIEDDIILLWNARPKIVTGQDILGRLMRGIVNEPVSGKE